MRPDLIKPRPLRAAGHAFGMRIGSPAWFAPFENHDLCKSLGELDLGKVLSEDMCKSLYKAETTGLTAAESARGRQLHKFGAAETQMAPSKDPGSAHTIRSKIGRQPHPGEVQTAFEGVSTLNTPEHHLAFHRASLDHHSFEYHKNNLLANDSSLSPEQRKKHATDRDEHQRVGMNAKAKIKQFEAAGIQDTPDHHDDWMHHYSQPGITHSGQEGTQVHPLQPTSMTMRQYHNNLMTGVRTTRQQDVKYGTPEPVDWRQHVSQQPYAHRRAPVQLGQAQQPTESLQFKPLASERQTLPALKPQQQELQRSLAEIPESKIPLVSRPDMASVRLIKRR